MIKRIILIIVPFLVSCAYSIHDVYVSDLTPYNPIEKKGEVVKSTASQFAVLGFVRNTDYVDQARQNLEKKCPSGEIGGVVTQLYTELGFFSWTNYVTMQGFCSKN